MPPPVCPPAPPERLAGRAPAGGSHACSDVAARATSAGLNPRVADPGTTAATRDEDARLERGGVETHIGRPTAATGELREVPGVATPPPPLKPPVPPGPPCPPHDDHERGCRGDRHQRRRQLRPAATKSGVWAGRRTALRAGQVEGHHALRVWGVQGCAPGCSTSTSPRPAPPAPRVLTRRCRRRERALIRSWTTYGQAHPEPLTFS
jgi:hypothetical protein